MRNLAATGLLRPAPPLIGHKAALRRKRLPCSAKARSRRRLATRGGIAASTARLNCAAFPGSSNFVVQIQRYLCRQAGSWTIPTTPVTFGGFVPHKGSAFKMEPRHVPWGCQFSSPFLAPVPLKPLLYACF